MRQSRCRYFLSGFAFGVIVVLFSIVFPQYFWYQQRESEYKRLEVSSLHTLLNTLFLPDPEEFSQKINDLPPRERAYAWMAYSGASNLWGNRWGYGQQMTPDSSEIRAIEELKKAQTGVLEYQAFLEWKYNSELAFFLHDTQVRELPKE